MNVRSLRPGGRLDRYIGLLFVSSYATALLLIVGLFWILDMAGKLDDFLEPWEDGGAADTMMIVRYYALNMPFLFLRVAPFVTLVAGMFTVNRLLRNNEVVAVMAAGISAHRLLLPIFVGALCAIVGMFVIREGAGVQLLAQRDALLDILDNQRSEPIYHDLWVRNLRGDVVHLEEYYPLQQRCVGFVAILRAPRGRQTVEAREALWVGEDWKLVDGVRAWGGEEPRSEPIEWLGEPGFTPELALTIRRARNNPLELGFGEVRELIRREPSNGNYRRVWHYHLTFPLANLLLLLVGLPVMLSFERGGGAERMALGGVLALFYFGADFTCSSLGVKGALSPVMASWLPVLFFGSLGIVLYDSMRT